jgi:hypothetical protein
MEIKMSGIKPRDLMNEGWISYELFNEEQLDREYTLKGYYELLLNALKMHGMYGRNKKVQPGMPLYERTNDLAFLKWKDNKVKSLKK